MTEGFNEQQMEAVQTHEGPLLVLAGAGSGKTRVITGKIAWNITRLYQDPASILAVTFTNKAADEMRSRLSMMIDPVQASRVVMKTFHSFGAWVLRRHGDVLGLNRDFVIYDEEDSLTLLHGLYPEYKRKDLVPFMKTISRLKDRCIGPGEGTESVARDPRTAEMYRRYQSRLEEMGNVDFGDLITRVIELFLKSPDVLNRFRQRFSTVLVDEYQDTNAAQFELLRMLYREGTHLCVVGDDDQSIYRFRGAEVRNILRFPDTFPGTRIVKLEENYRSTGRILAIASEVVKRNASRHEKQLWSRRPMGAKAQLVFAESHTAEAEFCASMIRRWGTGEGTAILYRTNAQSAAFETVFLRENIPYKIVGALRFFEREEIKDAMALLSLVLNPADEVAFRRMVNKPSRGIGKAGIEQIVGMGIKNMIEASRSAAQQMTGKRQEGLLDFVRWHDQSTSLLEHADLPGWITGMLQRSRLVDYHRKQDQTAATQRESNLEELVNAAVPFPAGRDGLREFLETLELDRSRVGQDDPANQEGVTLITMHNTKGLEFPRVIITGLEEGLFPGHGKSPEDLEEERRIFYVSITRAMDELYLTSCRRRFLWGRSTEPHPSRFLREIPPEHLETEGMQYQHHSPGRSALTQSFDEEPCRFSVGDRVYHDSYGSGYITSARREKGREVVTVQFETGHAKQFLPDYSPLEKTAHDW